MGLEKNNSMIYQTFLKNENIKGPEEKEDENTISLSEIADNSSISMQLGYGLIQLVDEEMMAY